MSIRAVRLVLLIVLLLNIGVGHTLIKFIKEH